MKRFSSRDASTIFADRRPHSVQAPRHDIRANAGYDTTEMEMLDRFETAYFRP
jgi:hypothetical protein